MGLSHRICQRALVTVVHASCGKWQRLQIQSAQICANQLPCDGAHQFTRNPAIGFAQSNDAIVEFHLDHRLRHLVELLRPALLTANRQLVKRIINFRTVDAVRARGNLHFVEHNSANDHRNLPFIATHL